MPAAPQYNRQFNFTNFQALNPATPLPGVNVDIELSSVKVTLDALIANAALIQRADGQLANNSVGPNQLQTGLLTGISPPTQWSGAGVNYAVGSTVFYGFLFYVCNTANISSNSSPPTSFGAWTFLADFSGVTIPAGSITSAAFAAGAVNSAALGANLALPSSPADGDNSTAIATTAFVQDTVVTLVAGARNKIINPNMAVDQRNGGSLGTAVGYTIDRWKYFSTQTGKGFWQQKSTGGPAAFPFSLAFGTSNAYTPASTDNSYIAQAVEANDCYDLLWGTASAVGVTLSFWAMAAVSGTFGGSVRNGFTGTRSYPFSFSLVGGIWQKVSVTIPGDTSGTWASSGNGVGLVVSVCLGAGPTLLGTAGAWAAGNISAPNGSGQLIGAIGQTFNMTGVFLQIGVGGLDFRSIALETNLCQRYYEVATGGIISGNVTSGASYRAYTNFIARKRAAPTVTFSAITATGFPTTAPSINVPDVNGLRWGAVSNATSTGGFLAASWAADADL